MDLKPYDRVYRLILCGDLNVGKTSLMGSFVNNTFPTRIPLTLGIELMVKIIPVANKIIKLQIWDTAGLERFGCISKSYYRGANGVILVYDVTDRKSFDNLSNLLQELYANCDQNPNSIQVLLVANKIDLDKRVVSEEEGKQFAFKNNLQIMEVSAKSNTNVTEVFTEIAKQIEDVLH